MPYKLILKVLGPTALLTILIFGYNNRINAAEERGYDSRNEEVTLLVDEITQLVLDKDALNVNLSTCKNNYAISQSEINELNSRILALFEEKERALTAQAESFASTQRTNSLAMNTLAGRVRDTDAAFAAISAQLNGVTYAYDSESNSCNIIGGGIVLRNAAKGRIGN